MGIAHGPIGGVRVRVRFRVRATVSAKARVRAEARVMHKHRLSREVRATGEGTSLHTNMHARQGCQVCGLLREGCQVCGLVRVRWT